MSPKPHVVKTNNRKDSVAEVKIRAVTFSELWSNYPGDSTIHKDPKTGEDTFDNHCAINVSDSLAKSGVSTASFKGTKCWNCPRKNGTHIVRAQDLADWLKKRPFPGCGKTLSSVGSKFKSDFAGKKGIIFFRDYWQRSNEKGTQDRTGDHVDLWDDGTLAGSGAVGSFFRVTIGFHWDGWLSDLELAKEVLLWEIK
jgi:hypothetical protein